MAYDVLIEVSDRLHAEIRDRLLSTAYRASRSMQIGIVLRGVSREEMDRRLDPVVKREGTNGADVRYLEVDDAQQLLRNGRNGPCLVVSGTPGWIPVADGSDVRVRQPDEGLALLEREVSTPGDGG